jgi:Sec-independent protein translocase protein TatA
VSGLQQGLILAVVLLVLFGASQLIQRRRRK